MIPNEPSLGGYQNTHLRDAFEVYLNVYDFTSANCVLQCLGIGAYHTGVELKYIDVNSSNV